MERQIEIIRTLATGERQTEWTIQQGELTTEAFEAWADELRELFFKTRSHDNESVHWSYCEGTHHDTTS